MKDMMLKVVPDEMKEIAAQISVNYRTVSELLDGIRQKAGILTNDWKGVCAALYTGRMEKAFTAGDEIKKRIRETVEDLEALAGLYATAESAAVKESEGLPTEGIFLV